MRNFIIFFTEKEGTSPLVRLLDHFESISVIHQANNKGWEPFNRHNCGPMPLRDLEKCLDMIFDNASIDSEQLNQIYTKTAKLPLEETPAGDVSVGFKMRFVPPAKSFPLLAAISRRVGLSHALAKHDARKFRNMMFDVLKKHEVVVFLAVRQDILRWALSKYHGSGSGKAGHLQFELAAGRISKDEIGKINIDCNRLEQFIDSCAEIHRDKRRLMKELKSAGIQTYPVLYEDFLADKHNYFDNVLKCLELENATEEIDTALQKGAHFEKVHSDDISTFVENHEEVLQRFGDRFISWV